MLPSSSCTATAVLACDSTPPGLADVGSAGTLGAWAAATTADSWAETEEPESLREKLLALPSEELFYSKLRKVRTHENEDPI